MKYENSDAHLYKKALADQFARDIGSAEFQEACVKVAASLHKYARGVQTAVLYTALCENIASMPADVREYLGPHYKALFLKMIDEVPAGLGDR